MNSLRMVGEWTNDCGGTKNYDSEILSARIGYYPRGGGFFTISNGSIQGNETRPEIKPCAYCSINLKYLNSKYETPDNLELIKMEFEADSEIEVIEKAEKWVQEKYNEIVNVILKFYNKEIKNG